MLSKSSQSFENLSVYLHTTGSLYKASYGDFSSLKISDLSIVFLNFFKGTHNKGSRHKENWDDCNQAKTLASNV